MAQIYADVAPLVELLRAAFRGSTGTPDEVFQRIKMMAALNANADVQGSSPEFKRKAFDTVSKKKGGFLNFWSPDRYLAPAIQGARISPLGTHVEFEPGADLFPGPKKKPLIDPTQESQAEAYAKKQYPDNPSLQRALINKILLPHSSLSKAESDDVMLEEAERILQLRDQAPEIGRATVGQQIERMPPNVRGKYRQHQAESSLKSREKEAKIAADEALATFRLAPKPWAPGSKEEYKEVHPPPIRNWGPGSKEEYKEVHPLPVPRRTDEAEVELYKKKKQIESDLKPPERNTLNASDVKVLRGELLRLYLTDPNVWGNAYEEAKLYATQGKFDDAYSLLSPRQQQVFEKVIADAHPQSKELGPVESLRRVLGWKPSLSINPPETRTKSKPKLSHFKVGNDDYMIPQETEKAFLLEFPDARRIP